MRPEIFLPLALLFLAYGVPSKAQNEPSAERTVSVRVGAPLTVECSVRVEQPVEWRLDEGAAPLPADLAAAGEAPAPGPGGRLVARLHAPAARPHHAGLYTCSRDPTDPTDRAHRVRVLVTAAAAAGAGETTTVAAKATTASEAAPPAPAPVSGSGLEQDVPYDVGRTFSLNCTSAGSPVDNAALSYVWKKNGTSVESVWDLAGRYTLEEPAVFRMTKRTLEDDFGVYTCEPAGGATVTFRVRGRPYAKLAANTNVVEDTKLKIVCKVVGKPHPRVTWRFANASLPGSGSNETSVPIAAALGARVTLSPNEQGVVDAQLQVEAAARSDAAVYTCLPEGADVYNATTTLRVKDKYAALWPFLGICAEVFVLCAIILVYERRRTKPELDDSDTDNHDQKKS